VMAGFLIPAEDHVRISAAVAAAESASDGEIGTMVARQSDDYAEWAVLLSTLASMAVPALIALWPDEFDAALLALTNSWHGGFGTGELMVAGLALQLLAFVLVWLLLRWQALRIALTPAFLKRARVHAAAVKAFKIGIESRTRAATGVLIYLSLAERRAEIIADDAITSRVGSEEWGEALTLLIDEVHNARPGQGIVDAVTHAGTLLARHFPRSHDDSNEMPDRLIEL
jgi:putative membrane protein